MFAILTEWALDPVRIAITNKVPVFKEGILGVKSRLDSINMLSKMLSIEGIAMDKKQSKVFLCQVILSITKPVKSFSITTKNNTLKNQVKTPFSILMKMRPQDLINYAEGIYDLILPMVPDLQAAGVAITVNDMTILQGSISDFFKLSNSPETSIQNRKATNENINTYVQEANDICHNVLDENIISFKNDALYQQEFHIKRHVNKAGFHHTRLEATAVTELGGGFSYCTITVNSFTKKGKTYQEVSGYADENGKIILSKFEPGMRKVTVSGEGIVRTKEFGPFNFESGKACVQLLICEPAFTNIPEPQQQQQNQNA
ncbi:MAG: hypothetical protein ABI855_00930 [Bacteroidota bacterium]